MNYVITYSDDYLAHHGIKGQHWGQRRYQNEDGSYTSAGRERYGIGDRLRGAGKAIGKGVRNLMTKENQYAYNRGKKLATEKFQVGKGKKGAVDYGHSNLSFAQTSGRAMKNAGKRGIAIGAAGLATKIAISQFGSKKLSDAQKESLNRGVDKIVGAALTANSALLLSDLNASARYHLTNASRTSDIKASKAGDSARLTARKEKYGSKVSGTLGRLRQAARDYRTYEETQRRQYDTDAARAKYDRVKRKNDAKIEKVRNRNERSYDGHEKGIYTKSGRMLLSADDVARQRAAVKAVSDRYAERKNRSTARAKAKYDRRIQKMSRDRYRGRGRSDYGRNFYGNVARKAIGF